MNKFGPVQNNAGPSDNLNIPNTSHNYRKVFKPNLNPSDNEAMNKLSSQSNKPNFKAQFNSNNDLKSTNKFNYNSSKPNNNIESKITKQPINPNFQQPIKRNNKQHVQEVQEIEDDRPAFAQGNPVE
jgi:hypothetical protein